MAHLPQEEAGERIDPDPGEEDECDPWPKGAVPCSTTTCTRWCKPPYTRCAECNGIFSRQRLLADQNSSEPFDEDGPPPELEYEGAL